MSPIVEAGDVVVEDTGEGALQVEVRIDGMRFLADEPVDQGGLGSGPNPYQLLGAALGACTVMTLKLYAARKKIALDQVRVQVRHQRDPSRRADIFHREIRLSGELSDAERTRLMEIAERCPVHQTLTNGATIQTLPGEPLTRAVILGREPGEPPAASASNSIARAGGAN